MCTRNWTDEELSVAQEWIKRDSQTLPLGRHCVCPELCYRRSNILSFYLCFGFFGLIVFAFGIYVGFVFVRPYRLSLAFENTTCMTSWSRLESDQWESCSCGWWCQSEYPCLKVFVNVTSKIDGDVMTMMHDTEMDLDGPCSYIPDCAEEKTENRHMVEEYQLKKGEPGTTFFCLYDPFDVQTVINVQKGNSSWMFHILMWPNVVALAFFSGVFISCLICGHRYVCAMTPPEEISHEAAQRRGETLSHLPRIEEGRLLKNSCENDYATINAESC